MSGWRKSNIRKKIRIKRKNYRNTRLLINIIFRTFNEGFDFLISLHSADSPTDDTFSERYSAIVFMQLIISRIGHDGYEKACLALCKIRRMFIEVILRGAFHTVDTVSEFYDIEIDFENPLFASQEFHHQRKIEFCTFSQQ